MILYKRPCMNILNSTNLRHMTCSHDLNTHTTCMGTHHEYLHGGITECQQFNRIYRFPLKRLMMGHTMWVQCRVFHGTFSETAFSSTCRGIIKKEKQLNERVKYDGIMSRIPRWSFFHSWPSYQGWNKLVLHLSCYFRIGRPYISFPVYCLFTKR